MLFCDLCDRGYHSYCVGLDEIPSGRWHCVEVKYYLLKIFNDIHFGNRFKHFSVLFYNNKKQFHNIPLELVYLSYANNKC